MPHALALLAVLAPSSPVESLLDIVQRPRAPDGRDKRSPRDPEPRHGPALQSLDDSLDEEGARAERDACTQREGRDELREVRREKSRAARDARAHERLRQGGDCERRRRSRERRGRGCRCCRFSCDGSARRARCHAQSCCVWHGGERGKGGEEERGPLERRLGAGWSSQRAHRRRTVHAARMRVSGLRAPTPALVRLLGTAGSERGRGKRANNSRIANESRACGVSSFLAIDGGFWPRCTRARCLCARPRSARFSPHKKRSLFCLHLLDVLPRCAEENVEDMYNRRAAWRRCRYRSRQYVLPLATCALHSAGSSAIETRLADRMPSVSAKPTEAMACIRMCYPAGTVRR